LPGFSGESHYFSGFHLAVLYKKQKISLLVSSFLLVVSLPGGGPGVNWRFRGWWIAGPWRQPDFFTPGTVCPMLFLLSSSFFEGFYRTGGGLWVAILSLFVVCNDRGESVEKKKFASAPAAPVSARG